MADTIRIDIEARDYASSVFRSVTSSARTFISNTNDAVTRFNSSLRGYNNAMRGFNTAVRRGLVDAGRAIYNFTTDAIEDFVALEKQHSKTMGAMQADYAKTYEGQAKFINDSAKLREQAIMYGTVGPTGQGALNSAMDVSLAQTALVKSGVTPDELLNTSALESVMKFAGGNDLGLEEAADFAIQASKMFNIPLDEWSTMFDKITYAADISPVDVEDIMASLVRGGGLAGSMGRPIDEVLAALSVMGYSGLKGGMAGTGLQAFYSRGIVPTGITTAGKAPTQRVEDIYKEFADMPTDAEGNFIGLEAFIENLSDAMADLTDEESVWFSRKLFGMFQQKAAFALGKTDEEGNTLYSDVAKGIENNSDGTIDAKWDIMLESAYGDIERVKNAFKGMRLDVGARLEPAIHEFSEQLFNFFTTGNYEFDFEGLRQAIYDSGDLIAEKYGEQIGDLVKNLGDFILDAIQIGGAVAPTVGGIGNGFLKLFSGDLDGAIEAFSDAIGQTNENIDGLPDDLQGMAKGVRNVIIALAALAAIDFGAKILEGISTIYRYTIGKVVSAVTKVTSGSTSVSSGATTVTGANTVVNGGAVTINGGAMTSTVANMTATTPLMNVTATVVNVFGGSGINTGSGGGGTPSLGPGTGWSPMLPSGGGTPMLPSGGGGLGGLLPSAAAGAGGAALYGAGKAVLPGAAQAALPGATAGAGAAAGEAINLFYNPLTGSYMTAGAMAKSIGLTALKAAPAIGSLALLTTVPSAESQPAVAYQQGFGTDYENYLGADYKSMPTDVGGFLKELFGSGGHWRDDGGNVKTQRFMAEEVKPATPDSYREARDELFASIEGLKDYATGQEYLAGMMDRWYYENSGGDPNFITEEQYTALAAALANAMGQYMEEHKVEDPSVYASEVPGMDTDIYQKVLNDMLAGINGQEDNSELKTAVDGLNQSTISLQEAVSMLSPEQILSLGQGPLSQEGVMNMIQGMLNNPTAQAANSELFNNLISAIREVEIANAVTVDIPRPSVNVDVKVNVDKSGNVTKTIIPNFSGFDSYMFQQTQRYGTATRK